MNSFWNKTIILVLFFLFATIVPAAAVSPRWTVEKSVSTILVSDDGSAIVAIGSNMYYLNGDGTVVWTDKKYNSADITADGDFVVAGGPYIVLYDRAGNKVWENENTGATSGDSLQVRISRNGDLILSSMESSFRTWGASGVMIGGNTSKTITDFEEGFTGAAVSPSGDEIILFTSRGVYATNRSGYLFNEDNDTSGEEDWKCTTGILSPDGKTVLCAYENSLYYGYPSGTLLWNKRISGDEISGIAMSDDTDPIIVAGSLDGKVYVLDISGNILWDYKLFSYRTGQPITVSVSRDGAYLTARTLDTKTMQGAVFLFDRQGSMVWSIEGSDAVGTLVQDGSALLVGTSSGLSSYAVADLTAVLATVSATTPVTTPVQNLTALPAATLTESQPATVPPASIVPTQETSAAATAPETTPQTPSSIILPLAACATVALVCTARRS